MRRKIVAYYDDEFDTVIAEWLAKIPEKKRSRAVRSLIIAAAMEEAGGTSTAEPAQVDRAAGPMTEEPVEAVEAVETEQREMVHLEFEPD